MMPLPGVYGSSNQGNPTPVYDWGWDEGSQREGDEDGITQVGWTYGTSPGNESYFKESDYRFLGGYSGLSGLGNLGGAGGRLSPASFDTSIPRNDDGSIDWGFDNGGIFDFGGTFDKLFGDGGAMDNAIPIVPAIKRLGVGGLGLALIGLAVVYMIWRD